jgi:iron complex transport system ATP-binding protein
MVTLRINGLTFGYRSHPVFAGITLTVERGHMLSIVGRNGAGKSTLLKCINHVLKPSQGSVFIGGDEVGRMSSHNRAQRFGYLPQKNEYLFPTTVFEAVLNGRYPHSPVRFTRRDEEVTAEVLAMMELEEFAGRHFDHLSGGEQQQVLIARALVQGADVLLFDEPTNNLDPRHQLQIMRLIRSIAHGRKITSLLAIHDLNLAAAFSDKVMVVHNGAVYAAGTPCEVFTVETLRNVFGIDVKIYDHHGVPHIVMLDG